MSLVKREASGADRDANRYSNPPPLVSKQLTTPSPGLSPDEVAIWCDTVRTMYWLTENHRAVFEVYVRTIARMRTEGATMEVASVILRCSKLLGGDPCTDRALAQNDENKITYSKDVMLNR